MDLKFAYLASLLMMFLLIALINTSYLLKPLRVLEKEIEDVSLPLTLASQALCAGLTEGHLLGIFLTIPKETREKCKIVRDK